MTADELNRVGGAPATTTLAISVPWPPLRRTWWVFVLGFGAIALFVSSYVYRVLCSGTQCGDRAVRRLFGLDLVGSVPRMFIVGLFVAATVLAWATVRRTEGPTRRWWSAVMVASAALTLAKLFTVHSAVKSAAPVTTLVAGTALAALSLIVLYRWGSRLGCTATAAVVTTFGLYAGAALGLDAVTTWFEALRGAAGFAGWSAGTFVEELGEALTALSIVTVLRWNLPVPVSTFEGE